MPDPHTTADQPDRPINVLVDAMSAKVGGGLTYISNQLAALAEVPGVKGSVLASPWNAPALADAQPWPVHDTKVRGVAHRYLWEQTVLRRSAAPGGADVVYFPANIGPIRRFPVPIVLTIQDANYAQPEAWRKANLSRGKRARQRLVQRSMAIADEVVLISDALRAMVAEELPEVAARATVIHSGAPSWPDESRPPAGMADLADLADLPDPADAADAASEAHVHGYVLAIANDYRHKGLDVLTAAWADASRSRAPDAPPRHLVICGTIDSSRLEALRAVAAAAGDGPGRFIHLGPVADRRELKWLVEHAGLLASASTLEAFPLTPHEGGLLGCPLLLSDIPAHREVADGRATFVAPERVDAWSAALVALWADPPSREPWSSACTWADNAAILATVLRRAADRKGRRA